MAEGIACQLWLGINQQQEQRILVSIPSIGSVFPAPAVGSLLLLGRDFELWERLASQR
jgi:hypothetical protein